MVQYVQWDDEKGFRGVIRHLPHSLEGRSSAQLAQLGYRERVTRHPEDFIPRFPGLLGSARFEPLPDGRVLETFPDADFSVAKVREELVRMARQDANRELNRTDWYIVRSMELNEAVPDEILSLRKKIRDHVDWIAEDVARRTPRELVDYTWAFPTTNEQVMLNGMPVILSATPPPPVSELDPPPSPPQVVEGEAQGVFGNADPTKVDPAPEPPPAPEFILPPETDGEVLIMSESEHPNFDPNDIPLVTVYAPNVDDPGPQPDQK